MTKLTFSQASDDSCYVATSQSILLLIEKSRIFSIRKHFCPINGVYEKVTLLMIFASFLGITKINSLISWKSIETRVYGKKIPMGNGI